MENNLKLAEEIIIDKIKESPIKIEKMNREVNILLYML